MSKKQKIILFNLSPIIIAIITMTLSTGVDSGFGSGIFIMYLLVFVWFVDIILLVKYLIKQKPQGAAWVWSVLGIAFLSIPVIGALLLAILVGNLFGAISYSLQELLWSIGLIGEHPGGSLNNF